MEILSIGAESHNTNGPTKLKDLLEQRIGTPRQQKWVTKLLGFDISVEYKQEKTIKWWMHSLGRSTTAMVS